MANRNLKKMYANLNSSDPVWNEGAQYLAETYGGGHRTALGNYPKNTLRQILNDTNYHFYIDGPNEGLYVA